MPDLPSAAPDVPAVLVPPIFLGGSAVYFSGEDVVRVVALNSASGVTLRLAGRFLPAGARHITPFNMSLVPTSDRVASSRSTSFGEGWLLDLSVIVSSGTPLIGQTWVRIGISRGEGTGANELSQLACGYVTAQRSVAWPLGTQDAPLDGLGALRSITGSVPAAGANISETVPTGARWQLISLATVLTSSATVATRVVSLLIDDGVTTLGLYSAQQTQTASQAITYSAAPGLSGGFSNSGNAFAIQAPPLLQLGAGYRLRTSVTNIQVGDQFTAPQMLVREWIAGE